MSEADSSDDSIEEVVDSMRRYANGSKVANRNEPAQLNRMRSPLMEQLDDHTLSSSISDDDGDIREGGPGPVALHDGQTPVAIPIFPTTPDLQPIISLISSLHATSHAQSSELVSAILDNHDQKVALDHAEREQNRQTVVQQVQDAQAEVARAWEDMRQQDDMREHNLKRLLEEVRPVRLAAAVNAILIIVGVYRRSNVYSDWIAAFPMLFPALCRKRPWSEPPIQASGHQYDNKGYHFTILPNPHRIAYHNETCSLLSQPDTWFPRFALYHCILHVHVYSLFGR